MVMDLLRRKRVVMSRRWIPILVLALGCGERRASLKVTSYATGTAIAGGALVSVFAQGEEPPGGPIMLGAGMFVIGSIIAVAAGIDALFDSRSEVDAPPPAPVKPPAIRPERERAWALTKVAALAARHEDCAQVRELSITIEALDAELHAVVFRRDVAIARCLEPPQD
jgi:hypothetical protein